MLKTDSIADGEVSSVSTGWQQTPSFGTRVLSVGTQGLLAIAIAFSVLSFALDGMPYWWPQQIVLAGRVALALAAIAGVLALRDRWSALDGIKAVLVLLGLGAAMRAVTTVGVGDPSWGTLSTQDNGEIWLSSGLGHAILRWVYAEGSTVGIEPVVAGIVTMAIVLYAVLLDNSDGVDGGATPDSRTGLVAAVALGSTPTIAIFAYAFSEVTPYAIPFALGSLVAFGAFRQDNAVSDVRFVIGVVSAVLAVAAHGAFFCLAPAVLVAVVVQKRPIRSMALGVIAAAVTLGVLFAWLRLSGYHLVPGDSSGGGDDSQLATDLFSLGRLASVATLAVCASPLLFISGVVRAMNDPAQRDWALNPVAVVAALGHWAFIALWGFDLGWPADADLKFVTAALSWPLTYRVFVGLSDPHQRAVAAVSASIVGWAIIGGLTLRVL